MTIGSLTQPSAPYPALSFEWPYRVVALVFLISTLWDSGARATALVGLSAPMFAMIPLTLVGLLLWRIPRDRIAVTCAAIILLWISVQLMAGESMRSAVLMGGVLVFSFVVAGVRSNPALLWFQMRAAALGPLLAAAAFYAGLYRVMGAGGMTLGSFNENAFAVYLGAGLIIALALVRRRERHAVLLSVAVAMAFLPPILVTGSRNGLVKAMICVGGAFVVQTRKRLALVALAGVLLLAGTLVTVSVAATAAGIEDGWTARYDVARLASAQNMRFQLISSGFQAGMRQPWIGHGIDAPSSFDWLSRNMVYLYLQEEGIGTINGYIDYFIMGGFPLVVLFLLLFLRITWRLFRATRTSSGDARMLFAVAFGLNLLFMLEVLTGETFGKFSWWWFGFGLQALGAEGMGASENHSPHARSPVDAGGPSTASRDIPLGSHTA